MDIQKVVIVAGLISALIAITYGIIRTLAWFSRRRATKRDNDNIYRFLLDSEKESEHEWRSTEAISKHTNIPPEKVVELCSRDKRIERNEKQREVWRLRK